MKNPQPEPKERGDVKSAHESRRAKQPYATELEDREFEREDTKDREASAGEHHPERPAKSH